MIWVLRMLRGVDKTVVASDMSPMILRKPRFGLGAVAADLVNTECPNIRATNHDFRKLNLSRPSVATETFDQKIYPKISSNNVTQRKNAGRQPHPHYLSTVNRANFGLQNTPAVASACTTCSIDSEHERYGESFAHDGCSGGGYARSWRVCGRHVSHTPVVGKGKQ
jgi:hypothetical protein